MKKTLLCLILLPLTGEAAQAPEVLPFAPAMASLSNELAFDALRGRVKTFEQILYGEDSLPLMVAKGRFDKSGCLVEYERSERGGESMHLIRQAGSDTLVSALDKRNTVVLDKHCQIVSITSPGVEHRSYLYRDGLFVNVYSTRDAWVYKEYFYTPEGMPNTMVMYGEQHDVLMATEPKRKLEEPWDFLTRGLDNGRLFYLAAKKCRYDDVGNPLECANIVETQDGGKTAQERQQIRYTTTYYSQKD